MSHSATSTSQHLLIGDVSKLHGASSFLDYCPIPPSSFLLVAAFSAASFNALFNFILARSTEVPLLKQLPAAAVATTGAAATSSGVADGPASPLEYEKGNAARRAARCGVSSDPLRSPECSPADSFSVAGAFEMTTTTTTTGVAPISTYGTLEYALSPARVSHAYAHHPYAKGRVWQRAHYRAAHANETDSLLQGEQLHFPATVVAAELEAENSASQLPPQRLLPSPILVTPTTTAAQALAGAPTVASAGAAQAAAEAAKFISKLKDIRLEAQYIVFDTNRTYLLISVVKCLVAVVLLHYHLDIRGGWNRYTVASGMGLFSGMLSPIIELCAAALLPNDAEVLTAELARSKEQQNEEEPRDSVLVVELVLRYCTYDFKDLVTVFIQGSVFILAGTVLFPPFVGFCVLPLFGFAWLFAFPVWIFHRIRHSYYAVDEEKLDASSDLISGRSDTRAQRSVQMVGYVEVLKCLLLKTAVIFYLLWIIQATFLLSILWKESGSYHGALVALWELEIIASPVAYVQRMGQATFLQLMALSQLIF